MTEATKRVRTQSGAINQDYAGVTIKRGEVETAFAVPDNARSTAFLAALGLKVHLMASDDAEAAHLKLRQGVVPELRGPPKVVLSKGREAIAHALAHEVVAAAATGKMKPTEKAAAVAAALPDAIGLASVMPKEKVRVLLHRRDVGDHYHRLHGVSVDPQTSLLHEAVSAAIDVAKGGAGEASDDPVIDPELSADSSLEA